MRATSKLALCLAIVGLLLAAGLWLRAQARVDACLDAGGALKGPRCIGARPDG